MFELLADLIAHRRIRFEKGKIALLDQPVCMFPVDYINSLQKSLDKDGKGNLTYYVAKEMGVRWFKNMYEYFKIKPEDVTKWGINVLSLAGWGATEIWKLDLTNKIMVVRIRDAAQAKSYGKFDMPVDNFVRGCSASAAQVLFQVECDAVETSCISLGHSFCEIICKPKSQIDMKDKTAARQLTP